MVTSMLAPVTLDLLAAMPATLRALLAPLPEAAVEAEDDEGRSARDVLAHLLCVELSLQAQMEEMLRAEKPPLPAIDEEADLERSGYRQRPSAWLLDEFERVAVRHVRWARGLTKAQLGCSGQRERVGEVTVANMLSHKALHEAEHLQQITSLLLPATRAQEGNLRLL